MGQSCEKVQYCLFNPLTQTIDRVWGWGWIQLHPEASMRFRKQEGPVCASRLNRRLLYNLCSSHSAHNTRTHRLKQTPNFPFVPYPGYPQITAAHATCQVTLNSCWWPQWKLPKCQAEVRDCHVCLEGEKSGYKVLATFLNMCLSSRGVHLLLW